MNDLERLEERIKLLESENARHVARLDGRVDALKKLSLPPLQTLEKKVATLASPFYNALHMFTHYVDKEFSLEQKKWFIEKSCFRRLGYFPNIDEPRSFNEKTQWYKLYYKDPQMTRLIDKYTFKESVTQQVGADKVVPLLGVWDRAIDVDFDQLPDRFVLKSNWGSGGHHVLIVRDKSKLNIDVARMTMSNWLQPWQNVYYHTFDWGYKNIPPKIIAEELIEDKISEYKFFCFNGEPHFFYVAPDSAPGGQNTHDYFDMDWNHLPFVRHSKHSTEPIVKPENFDEIVALSRTLSAGFPHVRVDICMTKRGLLVEELTFYTGSGTGRFNPKEWDFKLGEPFLLPEKRIIE